MVQVFDVNGDGLKDIYYEGVYALETPNQAAHWTGPFLFLNTGKGFRASSVAIPAEALRPVNRSTFLSDAYFVYDYDHDGREDLVDPHSGFMLRGTQRGTLEWTSTLEKSYPAVEPGIADLDGDGTADWFLGTGEVSDVRWGNPSRNGRLRLIVDGLGKYTDITYDRPENTAGTPVYVTGPNSNRPANVAGLQRVAPLVSKYADMQVLVGATGADDTIHNGTHLFQYFNANVGMDGRGWYGFERIQEQVLDYPDGNAFREIDTHYHNTSFRYAGRVREIQERSDRVLASDWHSAYRRRLVTTNTWGQELTAVGNESFTALLTRGVTLWEGEAVLWDVLTRYQYLDGVGNTTSETTDTTVGSSPPISERRELEYSDATDLEKWLVANPSRVMDTSIVGGHQETRETRYTYYANGLLETITRQPEDPGLKLTTKLTRDPATSVMTRVDAIDGSGSTRTTSIGYDSEKRYPTHYIRQKSEDNLALDTEVELDSRSGQVLTSMDPNGVVTQWQYDAFGRIRSLYTPTETATTSYISGASYLASVIGEGAMSTSTVVTGTGESNLTVTNVDATGRVRATVRSGVKGSFLFQEFTRDWAGRVIKVTVPHLSNDATQGAHSFSYDAMGRLASITAPDQRVTSFDYMSLASAPSSQAAFFSDPTEFAVEARLRREPNGLLEAVVFNHRGQPVRVAQSPASANLSATEIISGAAGATSQYVYGLFGQLDTATDSDSETTTITYDRIGRRVSIGNASTGTTAFTYNGFDEVTSVLEADGSRSCYTHDSLGRTVALTQGGSDGSCSALGSLIATWTYDGEGDNELGKLVSAFRASSPGSTSGTTIRYRYEPKPSGSAPNIGRLQVVEQETPELPVPLVATAEYTGPWLSKLHYPRESGAGFAVTFTRDPIGTVIGVARDGAPDAPYWELTRADQGQRIAEERFGSGTMTTYDYFAPGTGPGQCNHRSSGSCMPGALQAISTILPSGTAATELQYDYDEADYLANVYHEVSPDTSDRYSYDVYGRLTAQARLDMAGMGTVSYWSYTPGGKITEVLTGDPRSGYSASQYYTCDSARGHLLRQLSDTAGKAQTFEPDAKGNTISRNGWSIPNGSQALEYNESNLPTAIRGGPGGDTLFEYDADLRRSIKRGPIETTVYLDDLFECVGNTVAQGPTFGCSEQRFKVFAGSRQVAVVKRDRFGNDVLNYIHSDHLGSGTAITDSDGNIVEHRSYDAFGQVTTNADMSLSPVKAGFTGHEHDAELGLINMRGRIYDPLTRRFLTPDPYVTAYVRNNPLNFVDPSGFDGQGPDHIDIGPIDVGAGPMCIAAPAPTQSSGASNVTVRTDQRGTTFSGFSITNTGGGPADANRDASGRSNRGNVEGRQGPTNHGGGPGANYQAPGNQDPSSLPQAPNAPGPSWNPSNSGTPTSSGGSQGGQPLPVPGAGSAGRTNANVQGSGATMTPLPYMPDAPAWLQEAALMAVTMSVTPGAKLVFESFSAARGAAAVETFGRASVGAAERGLGRALP